MNKLLTLIFFVNIAMFSQTPGGVSTTNMSIWLSGDSNVTDSGTLTWGDKSGVGYDVYQAIAANKPTQSVLFNYNETFTFDGVEDYLAVQALNYTNGSSISDLYAFVVYRTGYSGSSTSNWAFLDFDRSESYSLSVGGSGLLRMSYQSAGAIIDADASTVTNNNSPHIGTFIFDNSLTNETQMRADGKLDYNQNRVSTDININANRYGFVGDGSEATSENGTRNDIYYDGEIAEIILFDKGSITATEVLKIESYLALKYGITLDPSTATYLNSSGTTIWDNTTYWNNVAGIINDSSTGTIHQKIAKSEKSNLIVATDNDYTSSNNSGSRTTLSSGAYLLFGENGLAGYDVYDMGANENILRTNWLFKEGGTDTGTVYVAFPKSELPTGTSVDLIVSSDDAFDGTDTRYTMTDDGTYYYRAINISDGDYVTFIVTDAKIAGVSVSNFDIYLRADNTTTSGGDLSLTDGSFNNAHAYQSNTSNIPSTSSLMNFNPTLDFDGSSDYMYIKNKKYTTSQAITDLHAFAVYSTSFENESYNSNWAFLDFDRSESYNMYIHGDGRLAFSYQSSGTKDLYSNSLGNDGLPHIAEYIFDASLTDETFMKFDGNTEYNSNLTTGNIVVKSNRYGFIGDGSEASSENGSKNGIYYDGQISEIILADRQSFTATESLKIETYLALKYGITLHNSLVNYLSADGTVLWNNTSYWTGIAGIVKDDIESDLDQKVSQSTSAKDLILSTTLDFSSSNLDGSRTSVTEGSSLLFGNNGLSTGIEVFNLGANEYITTRKWLFKEVGTDTGNIYVAIPKSYFSDDVTMVELLVSTDDTFDGTDTRLSLTDDGTNYYINQNIVDGDRIAFIATIPSLPAPGNVSNGLSMWIKADNNAVSSNGILTSIGGSTTNGYGVSQTTNILKPSYETNANYNPSVEFDGTNDYLAVENLSYSTSGEITKMYSWVVYKTDFSDTPSGGGYDTSNWALFDYDRNEYFSTSIGGDGKLGFSYTASGATYDGQGTTTGTNNGQAHLGGFIFDTALGTNETVIRLNGADDYTGNLNNNAIGSGTTRFGIVGDGSSATTFDGGTTGNYYQGEISEIVHYTGATLSSTEISRIESYLAIKYGITLDASGGGVSGDYLNSLGTTIWDASANSVYGYGVAAIGQDDESELYQKQSKSEVANSILTISIDTSIASSNQINAGSFDDDLDFLFWSNNSGGSLVTIVDADIPTGTCLRSTKKINRDWKAHNIGFVGAVTLSFDMSSIPDPDNYDLLIDEDGDGDFDTGTVESITTGVLTGNNLVFTGVTLLDGEGFTLESKTRTGLAIYGNGVWYGGTGTSNAISISDSSKSVQILENVTLSENAVCDCMNVASGSVVTVPTGQYIEVINALELDGDLYLEGTSELIQTGATNANLGSGQVYKILNEATSSIFRYNYFSSPVHTSGTFSIGGDLKINTGATLGDNTDPSFITNDLDGFGTTFSTRWFHTMINDYDFTEIDENTTMIPGIGFTMKGTGQSNAYNLIGTPNNGNVDIVVSSGRFLLTGNPYPSTISANAFNTANSSS
ncbi:hypothetical protein FHR24_002173, partial [Wenyingzhuangia heitensis]|nr:hypothetical protein [Wenyingzhuangia heitensis]